MFIDNKLYNNRHGISVASSPSVFKLLAFCLRGDTLIFHIFKLFSSSRLSPGGRKALYILPPVVPFTYGRLKDAEAKIYIFPINKEEWKKKIQSPLPFLPFTCQYLPFIIQKPPFTKKNLKCSRFWVGL